MERLNLKKLKEVEGTEQYRVEISSTFTALEILDTEVDKQILGNYWRQYQNFSQRGSTLS
jgi:hypothetical protein